MNTLGAPVAIVAEAPCSVLASPTRAAGLPPMKTVADAVTIGPPTCGTVPLISGQVVWSPSTAAVWPPIRTLETPGPTIVPPWFVRSPTRAAGLWAKAGAATAKASNRQYIIRFIVVSSVDVDGRAPEGERAGRQQLASAACAEREIAARTHGEIGASVHPDSEICPEREGVSRDPCREGRRNAAVVTNDESAVGAVVVRAAQDEVV